jgi:serine/threonine protein kinase
MALTSGAQRGPYESLSAIGAGGMDEVYRARDSKLNREVALKVLPAAMANDAERIVRFQHEAQVHASLNHPNIASIHGLEDWGGLRALVMELVDGPTLAELLETRSSKTGLHCGNEFRFSIFEFDPLPIAKQIAEALEAAHQKGIIHRGLKPANVKITPDGMVKVLYFGLAKALDTEDSASDISNSPTIMTAATLAGVILGATAYMSPEMARRNKGDKRADIWAFGCVLFEMLAGGRRLKAKPFQTGSPPY